MIFKAKGSGGGGGTGDVNWGGNTNGAAKSIGSIDNFAISLKTNNVSRLTITESGYIGLRKTPTAPIDIAGSVVLDTNITIMVGENETNYLGFSGTDNGIFQQSSAGVIKNQIWAAGNSYINGGNLGIGTTTPLTKLTILDTSASSPRGVLSLQINDGVDGARLGFAKARGTEATKTTVNTGDTLGSLIFRGYDGANFLEMASIDVGTSGTIGLTRVPTYLAISTATDAAPSVLTERLRILNNGNVGIGTTNPSALLNLIGGAAGLETAILKIRANYVDVGTGATLKFQISSGDSSNIGGEIAAIRRAGNHSDMIFRTASGAVLADLFMIRGEDGNIAIGHIAPTKKLSFSGQTDQTLGLERHTTANTAGSNFTINGGGATAGATDKNAGIVSIGPGPSTGTGLGSLRLQGLTRAASTGTTDNALVDRIIVPSRKYLTDGTVVGLFEIALGNNQTTGGTINYTLHATDGTEYQSHTGIMNWAAVSKGSVITSAFGHVNGSSGLETDAGSSGSLSDTFSVVAGTGKITISLSANSSLTTPSIWIEYIIFNQGSTAITQL